MRGKLTTATGSPPVKHFPGEGLRQRQRTIARCTLHAWKTSRAESFVEHAVIVRGFAGLSPVLWWARANAPAERVSLTV